MKIIGKTIVHLGKKFKAISEYENLIRAESKNNGKTTYHNFKRQHFLEKLGVKPKPKQLDPVFEALERDLAQFEKGDKQDTQTLLEKMRKVIENAKKQVKQIETKGKLTKAQHTDLLHKAYNIDLIKKETVPVEELQSFDNSNLKGIIKTYKVTSDIKQKGGIEYKEDIKLFRKDVSEKVKSIMKYSGNECYQSLIPYGC
jgi:hypothetical protein